MFKDYTFGQVVGMCMVLIVGCYTGWYFDINYWSNYTFYQAGIIASLNTIILVMLVIVEHVIDMNSDSDEAE